MTYLRCNCKPRHTILAEYVNGRLVAQVRCRHCGTTYTVDTLRGVYQVNPLTEQRQGNIMSQTKESALVS